MAPSGPAAALPAQYAHPLGWIGGGKVVSLTFDDGPSEYTDRVLDVLHQGLGDPKYRACPLLRRYVAAGQLGRKTGHGVYVYP